MNRVSLKESTLSKTTLGNVINKGHTAFVGQCGLDEPGHTLYLITFARIIRADCPQRTWSGSNCSVIVDRYVDVEIKEI